MDDYKQFIETHRPQLVASGVPEIFWSSLCNKLSNQIFDAGEVFSLYLIDYSDSEKAEEDPTWTVMVTKEDGLESTNQEAIFLIDHAWTFRNTIARKQLEQTPALVNRLAIMMGIEENQDFTISKILTKLWSYSNHYSLNASGSSAEDRVPIWFVMDEFGSALQHSNEPNFRVVPFLHIPEQITYSLLYPLVDVEEGDPVTRDFMDGTPMDSVARDVMLKVFDNSESLKNESFIQSQPPKSYFLEGHIEESLPDKDVCPPLIDGNRPLKVYAEYDLVSKFLTDSAFELVEDSNDADIVWMMKHFKGYEEFSQQFSNKFINQFPFENVITIKDLLSLVCRRANPKPPVNMETLETSPEWLPTTYNLKTELLQFVSYFQNREAKGLDNHWIIKPWNLARSLDMTITSNLKEIMKLSQTGPKIAQKYVENPVLFDRLDCGRVKFDVRYVILLKSVDGVPEAFFYRNFFLRFANKQFALNNFEEYEQHFTVMNYGENLVLKHMKCDEFLDEWKQQYADQKWEDVEQKIHDMLGGMLAGATSEPPPCGIASSSQSRALYAADIILSWENGKIQPKLLEVNFMPDCKRACDYYPEFWNDIFKLLFLDQDNPEVFRRIEV